MKRVSGKIFFIFVLLIFVLSFVSAGFFSDFWNKFTGKMVDAPNEFSESKNFADESKSIDEAELDGDKDVVESEVETVDEEKNSLPVFFQLKLNKKNYALGETIRLI
ncbi:MAG: hypothetical protein NUV46_02155 [Nanoarchaeota archaeon]|nr:hypothetical protein [Nanoarchaeota archaeon]